MITLSKSGSTVTFTFDENSWYLQNGTIDVPVNSLSLVIDESNMATFKKSASNDIFISARYEEFGMSKADLEAWYKANMVGSTGGGGGGVTPEEVQGMIDESISGKADSVSAVSSAEYVSSSTTINFKNVDGDVISSIDASDFVIDGMIDDVRIETISGVSYLVIDFNTASGKEDIQIPLTDIFDPSNYYDKDDIDGIISGLTLRIGDDEEVTARALNDLDDRKLDASAYTPTDLSEYWTSAQTESAINQATSGKASQSDLETVSGNVSTINSAVSGLTSRVGEDEEVTARALIDLDTKKLDASAYTPTDLSNYYTSAQTEAAISAATSGKVNTSAIVTAVTSGSTDDEIPTAKAVYDATQGGGGTTYTAGRGIDITNDTISFSLPISANTYGLDCFNSSDNKTSGNSYNANNIIIGRFNEIGGNGSASKRDYSNNIIRGFYNKILDMTWNYDASAAYNYICGWSNTITGASIQYTTVVGNNNKSCAGYQTLFGDSNIARNKCETVFGQYNNSVSASTTFGNSGNTLFSVGNGIYNDRHNAFEIRQNGDIYLTSGGTDIKLQDHLGGGSITIDPSLDSGSTNAVANSAITTAIEAKLDVSAITTTITSGSTDSQVPSAKAVYDTIGNINTILESI